MFSSVSFIVSGLTFLSLIHFDFIFVYGIREYYNSILSHIAIEFSHHHLLKKLAYPPAFSLSALTLGIIPVQSWVFSHHLYTDDPCTEFVPLAQSFH